MIESLLIVLILNTIKYMRRGRHLLFNTARQSEVGTVAVFADGMMRNLAASQSLCVRTRQCCRATAFWRASCGLRCPSTWRALTIGSHHCLYFIRANRGDLDTTLPQVGHVLMLRAELLESRLGKWLVVTVTPSNNGAGAFLLVQLHVLEQRRLHSRLDTDAFSCDQRVSQLNNALNLVSRAHLISRRLLSFMMMTPTRIEVYVAHRKVSSTPGWFVLCNHLHELHASILVNELFDAHEATADSDHQLTVDDLGDDPFGSKQVFTNLNTYHFERCIRRVVDSLSEHFIDKVALDGAVDHLFGETRVYQIILELLPLAIEQQHLSLKVLGIRYQLLDCLSVMAVYSEIFIYVTLLWIVDCELLGK